MSLSAEMMVEFKPGISSGTFVRPEAAVGAAMFAAGIMSAISTNKLGSSV
jgi:hypothetical protein